MSDSVEEAKDEYLDLILAVIPPRGEVPEDQIPAIAQYLRMAQQEGVDPVSLYEEVQAVAENAPEPSSVLP